MRDQEYDRFGPWVVEISDEDPPPPLFVPYLKDQEAPLLSIKIPRDIERRNAHPGMDLYDYVVSLQQDGVRILQRVGKNVKTDSCAYTDIRCIQYVEDLLDGRFRLFLPTRSVELPFNSVSSDVMLKLLQLIRERYMGEAARGREAPAPATAATARGLSFYFAGLFREFRASFPGAALLAAQPETDVKQHETGGLRRLFFRLIGKKLMESLHLSDGRELVITDRGRTFRYLRQAEYARYSLFMPSIRSPACPGTGIPRTRPLCT